MNETNPATEELEALAGSNGWVFGLARGLVGDAQLAEDLVQEAYLQALSTPAEVRESTQAWISGVVRDLARSLGRERKRRREREERSARREALESTADNVARLEQQKLLIQALLALGETYRTALLMRYVDGLPPREIAAQLDVPVATVNSRLARALLQLRSELSAAHGGDRSRWLTAFAPLLQPPAALPGPPLPLAFGALMMKYKLASVAAVLVLCLSAWFVLRDLQSPAFESADAASATLASPADSAPEGGATLTAPAERVASSRTPRAGAALATIGGKTVSLLVRDGESGAPVAGAGVHVMDWSRGLERVASTEAIALFDRMPWGGRELMRRRGERLLTDDEGRVQVPLSGRSIQVFAEHGATFGTEHLSEDETEKELDLFPDRPLRVGVVDERGRPLAGVPVMLGAVYNGGLIPISTGRTELTADGREALAPLVWSAGFPDQFNESLFVALRFPTAVPVRRAVALHAWPAEPVTLECPPFGSVLVRTRKPDGTPAPDGKIVRLAAADESGGTPYLSSSVLMAGVTSEGGVRFRPVGLGLDLVAAGWFRESGPPKLGGFEGPRFAGEVVEVELLADGTPVRLVGRILEADGEPCVARSFRLALAPGASLRQLPLNLETDGEGRFEIDHAHFPDHPVAGDFELVEYTRTGPRTLGGVLPDVPVADEMDLGDFRFAPLPATEDQLLVTGRVVDPDGAPVPSALVRWVEPLDPESNAGWRGAGPMAMTRKDGTFTISGERPGPAARLQVQPAKGCYHEPEAVPVPAAGVELRMTAGATLAGRVLLEEGLAGTRLSIDLWNDAQGPAPSRADVWGWRGVSLTRERFRFEGLAEGTYTLRVASASDPDPLVVAGIHVFGTGDVRDPRLDPVDMTGRYRVVSLRAVDEEGAPVNAAVYAFEREESADGTPQVTGPRYLGNTDRGRFLCKLALEHAFIVEADGYFPVSLDPRDLPAEVVLRRGWSVELEWTGGRTLDELPFDLLLRLVPEQRRAPFGGPRVESYLRSWSPAEIRIADAVTPGAGRLHVPGPGSYRLVWETDYEYRDGYHMNRVVELDEEPLITVANEGDLPVAVALSSEVLDREIAWMRERFERAQDAGQIPADLAFGEKASSER